MVLLRVSLFRPLKLIATARELIRARIDVHRELQLIRAPMVHRWGPGEALAVLSIAQVVVVGVAVACTALVFVRTLAASVGRRLSLVVDESSELLGRSLVRLVLKWILHCVVEVLCLDAEQLLVLARVVRGRRDQANRSMRLHSRCGLAAGFSTSQTGV